MPTIEWYSEVVRNQHAFINCQAYVASSRTFFHRNLRAKYFENIFNYFASRDFAANSFA